MKERPIIFKGAMVRAVLNGSKTQTRRFLKAQVGPATKSYFDVADGQLYKVVKSGGGWIRQPIRCPYGKPGDRLWVRETWTTEHRPLDEARSIHEDYRSGPGVYYRADRAHENSGLKPWKPSIHMFRWASRIMLEVLAVRAEQIKEISARDARSEGWPMGEDLISTVSTDATALEWFRKLWDGIHGTGAWERNDWVWVVEFDRVVGG